jgi:hypothetical protein
MEISAKATQNYAKTMQNRAIATQTAPNKRNAALISIQGVSKFSHMGLSLAWGCALLCY